MASTNSLHFEDFTIVWLDNTIESDDRLWSIRRRTLQAYVNCIEIFVVAEKCLEYIRGVPDESIFCVIPESLNESVIRKIHDLSQVAFVYVLRIGKVEHGECYRQFSKIHGVFDNESELIAQLQTDLSALSSSMHPFGIISSEGRSLHNVNVGQATFLWHHLLIDVLLHLPQTSASKKEMIDECRAIYKNDETELKKIVEFEKTYHATTAIHWYTKDTFVYRLFNKAFRTQNMDIIIKYRFFLVDLVQQLSILHISQFRDNIKTGICYRGQYMYREELEKLRYSTGHLIAANSFVSASISCQAAVAFCPLDEKRPCDLESVMFEIKIDPSVRRKPFGEVSCESMNRDENEVLFSIGSIFRVEGVDLNIGWISHIHLSLTDEMSDELTSLLSFYQAEHIGETPSIVLFGLFLSKKGALDQAENFYYRLLEELPEDHQDIGVIYINLGEVLRQQGYLQLAELYFRRALSIFRETVTESHPYCAIVHSNMGSLYSMNGQYQTALQYYRRALSVLEEYTIYIPYKLLSTVHHGMAVAYQNLGDVKSAFTWYAKVLDIEEAILPKNHPSLSITYGTLAELNAQTGNVTLARQQFERALSIMENALPRNHLEQAVILMKFGSFQWDTEKNASEALIYYQQAERIVNQTETAPGSRIRQDLYAGLAWFYALNDAHKLAIRNYDKFIYEFRIDAPYDLLEIARCSCRRSISMFNDGDSSNAFKLLTFAFACVDELPRTSSSVLLRMNIADEFRRTNHLALARNQYERLLATELDRPMTRPNFIATLYNNLGTVDQDLEDYQSAFLYYKKALEHFIKDHITSSAQLWQIHYNIGIVYKNLNRIVEARSHLHSALDLLLSAGNNVHENEYVLCKTLAQLYEQTSEWSAAKVYYERTLDVRRQWKPNEPISSEQRIYLQNAIDKINGRVSASTV